MNLLPEAHPGCHGAYQEDSFPAKRANHTDRYAWRVGCGGHVTLGVPLRVPAWKHDGTAIGAEAFKKVLAVNIATF
jgi:hypothetical protein